MQANTVNLRGKGKGPGERFILSPRICPMKCTAGEEVGTREKAKETAVS